MAGIGRTPLPTFVGGAIGIILYFVWQLKRPFLSNFQTITGEMVKHKTVYNYERKNEMIKIWLNDTLSEPYINYYNDPQKAINKKIDNIKNLKIWFNENREIMQLEANNIKVVDYDWFAFLFLIILAMGLFFHIASYLEAKKKTNNINTYWDMWDYAFGGRVPIMKHNNKPYNPNDVIDLSWGKKKQKNKE